MTTKMDIKLKACVTPEFRVSFPQVFEPKAFNNNEAKYSIVMLFDKTADLKDLKRAVLNAAIERFGPKEEWPSNLRLPFKDGNDKPDLNGYENKIVVSATSKQRPQVVGGDLNPIIDKEAFYAGCYAKASLLAFAYDVSGNKGVSFGVSAIQKQRDGEKFGGRPDASQVFTKIDDGSDNAANYSNDLDSALGL